VARFQVAPKESHVLAVKKIFRYLKGTKDFGLWYPKGKDLSLISYTNSNWAVLASEVTPGLQQK
jgi:hypothetical protein